MDLQLQRAVRVEHLALEQTLVNGGFWPTAGPHHRQLTGSLIAVPMLTMGDFEVTSATRD
jgi:hypothetical protein